MHPKGHSRKTIRYILIMILYEKIESTNLDKVMVYWNKDGSFLECHPNDIYIGWKRLLSGYYIKLSQDWVPGEVVHCQLQAPLQVRPVEQEDEKLVQQWYACMTRKETLEMKESSSSSKSELPEQRHQQPLQQRSRQNQVQQYQQQKRQHQQPSPKYHSKSSHIDHDQWMGVLPKQVPATHPLISPHLPKQSV